MAEVTTAAAGVAGLLQTQAVRNDTSEQVARRRRAVGQARGLLSALDAVKVGMLADDADAALSDLKQACDQAPTFSGDPALDVILDHIRLRAEVELAKAATKNRPAG